MFRVNMPYSSTILRKPLAKQIIENSHLNRLGYSQLSHIHCWSKSQINRIQEPIS